MNKPESDGKRPSNPDGTGTQNQHLPNAELEARLIQLLQSGGRISSRELAVMLGITHEEMCRLIEQHSEELLRHGPIIQTNDGGPDDRR